VVAFFTTLLFAELARIVPLTGGGYAYAYKTLSSFGSFMTGWFLALGSIFACSLYAIGFAEYFSSFLGYDVLGFGVKFIAILAVAAVTLLNTRGTKSGDRIQQFLTWGNVLILALLIIASLTKLKVHQLTPLFPRGIPGTYGAIAIIYISFFGYQLIANNTDEIVDPTRTVPRAMVLSMCISIVLYVLVALVSIMVVPWQELSATSAPLVVVATRSFGNLGWIIISTGGVLAAAGALNSTLLSQGRQIYAMGNHRFLPPLLGTIHEVYKTPRVALLTGGGLVTAALCLLELQFIAKSANFCLLCSLLPVSLALRKIYTADQSKRPAARWKWYLPEITLITNIALLLTLDWLSLIFGLQLGLLGTGFYLIYSRRRESRSRAGLNVVLVENKRPLLSRGIRILVPIANPQTQRAILSIANALLSKEGGEVVALSVITTPEQMDFYSAFTNADSSLELMQQSTEIARLSNVPIKPVIRAARSVPKGILHAAEEEACNLTIMGYGGQDTVASASLMEEILHHSRTDIIFVKLKKLDGDFSPRKIAVSLGGRVNLELAIKLAGALADYFASEMTFLNILPEDHTPQQREYTDRTFIEVIHKYRSKALYNIKVIASDNPIETLVETSRNFDLLIVGTAKSGLLKRATVGTFSTQIAERSHCSVAAVRVVPRTHKIIQSI
jgi:amino acid transporter/nucleotide-binding universal stress UspA family protein